ncbi:MAG: hypothetical protein AB1730_25615 [Myxococcota bacterium]|jgi:hypothetical protein
MRRGLALALLLSLSACKKEAPPAPPAPAPRLAPAEVAVDGAYHAVACGAVTAVFSGNAEALPANPPPPKSYGVESLAFRFADGSSKGFAPTGQLFFSDWRFDIFSPDCEWVALLTDHYGPYHLVKTAELAGYLTGKVKPVVVRAAGETASVHSDGAWTGDGAFEFFASCCGGAKVLKATTAGAVTTVFEATEAPNGLRRVRGGYEVVTAPPGP